MFIRRHYYDLTTGKTLQSYQMEGDIAPNTQEQDAELFGLTNWGAIEWNKPDEEMERNFRNAASMTVNVLGSTPTIQFGNTPRRPDDEADKENMGV